VVALIDGFELDRAESVARAFTVYFQLVNLAEERHRVRILRERSHSARPVAESLAATVAELTPELGENGLADLLARLEVQPVLTAHPTEARRRAVVDALRRIAAVMDRLDDNRLTGAELAEAERQLGEQLTILWRTAQLRRQRPTPLDEVRSVMSLFDETLFRLAPALYRELERAAGMAPPGVLRWGSWVGGDRDGNPNLTHQATEAALEIQSEHVLLGLEAAARRIGRSLTVSEESTPPSPALVEALGRARDAVGAAAAAVGAHSRGEPHRELLLQAAQRLGSTRRGQSGGYGSAAEFQADLRTIQESLRAGGAGQVADGELQNLAWQAGIFGFHLASLEIRQHSSVHRQALEELVTGSVGEATAEVLATLQTMARLQARFGTESCRRYVVSFTRSPADVMAVHELASHAVPQGGLELDVVPLFESRSDLEAAPGVLDELFELPDWRRWLESRGNRLEVMLGYSDAAKDAGYLSANLALYEAQSALAAWARRNGVVLTLFHGRGGAVGRGGGPAGRAIRSQAPGSLSGRFKVTEQGEVIFARYGNAAIGLRHLEQVVSAVLVASTPGHEAKLKAAEERYRVDAALMAETSEAAYRRLVGAPGFPEFFARVTPLEEIGRLAIGSRPARRGGEAPAELEQLRAITWVFAWTQNRCNLPGWYGLGSGLQAVVDRAGLPHLVRMASEWPLLASIIDNAEMSLAKADPMIAGLYLARGGRPELVDAIREEFRLTRRLVLKVIGGRRLLERHPILRLAVDLRNPYVDALSLLQLRFLRQLLEAQGASSTKLSELVRLTVGGVAAGLQNTG